MSPAQETTPPSILAPQPTPEAEEIYLRWIGFLDNEFGRHHKPNVRAEIVREQLHQLYFSQPGGAKLNFTLTTELPTNVLQLSLDPRNVTLPEEYDETLDHAKYDQRKPLIWFWRMFDRSPVGLNLWLGFRFRIMLGRHIFRHIGSNVLLYPNIHFTFGYNLTIEDDCSIHTNAILDDRQALTLQRGSNISPGATYPATK
ncbi:MAG TPA: hypothetical protein VM554_14595 [Acidisarcina sp.]|nr:hypothetical protein [Acidisarcina sp.]